MKRQSILASLLALVVSWSLMSAQAAGAPSLTLNGGAAPITVAPGATITINVVNPTGNTLDWIGIYLVGQSSSTKSVVEHYVTWTAGYTIPTTTPVGTYEARLFSNDTITLLATSATITVSTGTPPAAPSGLGATAVSSSAINLSWADQSNNETGFKIERAIGGGAFSQVATVGANVTIYADSGLTASTSYSYRVRASNTAGDSAYSNTASATTQAAATIPAAPSGLGATAVSSSAINLSWADQSNNETGFKIERAIGGGAFSQVATVGANVTIYADSGLTATTNYSYRVRATNSVGDSAYSNTASATTTAQAQTPATVGQWSLGPVWDITPVNMLVLPSGKVMFYPGLTVPGDDARLWDPGTNTLTSLAKAGFDLFCTGHTFLPDGTILFTGGTLTRPNTGIAAATVYNPVTNVWTRVPDMNGGRWYPSTTFTGGGEVLVTSGWVDNVQHENALSQVWQPSSGTWRNLTTAMLKFWMYSMVYWAPSGKAIIVGPDRPTYYLDISGTGTLTSPTSFNYPDVRDYGSSVMYSSSKILIAGGGDPPTNTAEIFDLNAGTWQYTNPMANHRRQFNLVLLPDDNVLAVGGTSGPGFNDQTSPVYASEMWNPSTMTWTTMASQTVGRFYHSVAVLLPDGRVLSGGGTDMYQTEFYSPPYLFKGARPTIASAPSAVPYSAPFFVGTPDATSIATVRLIRLPANTHAFDQNQRIIPISFTQGTGGLNLTAPSDPNQAPPGHYMLFILNGSGVPSLAKIIQLGSAAPPPTPPTAPSGLGATAVSSSAINLSWTDQSSNETGFKIERAIGGGAFSPLITVGANASSYGDSGLTASTSYSYRVLATNSVGDSPYSNTASATTQATPSPPAAPTGLAGTAVSSSAINLTWTDQSSNETGFKIERAIGGGAFSQVATVGANVTIYADSGLTASTSYSYRVRATNSVGDSAYSNTASATTQATVPAKPSGLVATAVSQTQINLTWVDQSNNEDGFKIERKQGGGTFTQIATVGANITTYSDTGLTRDTQYTYRARAYNSIGNSAYSNTDSAKTRK